MFIFCSRTWKQKTAICVSLGFFNRRIVEPMRAKVKWAHFHSFNWKPQKNRGGQKALIGHPKEQPISTTIKVSQNLWNLVEIVKFGWNCEIWLKLWNLVEFVKFGWNCEIWSKLWNLVEIVKFGWNCEIWSKYLGISGII